MKRAICFVLFAGLLVRTASAEQRRYAIQPTDGNRLELRVFKTGLYRGKFHTFVFPNYTAALLYDAQRPEASHIEFKLAAAEAKCIDTWLDAKDLKSVQEYALKDMLAAERHPEIVFRSSEIRPLGENRFDVRGTLTIRDKPKPAVVEVTLEQRSDGAVMFKGTSTIRLTDYGLKPPKAFLGVVGTKNEMEFSFSLRAYEDAP